MSNPRQQPNLTFEALEGLDEVVVINHDESCCVSLNLTAAAVLEMCDGSKDIPALANELASAFGTKVQVDPAQVRADVETILQQLQEHHLLIS